MNAEANHNDNIRDEDELRLSVYREVIEKIMQAPAVPIVVEMDSALFARYHLPELQKVGLSGKATIYISGVYSTWTPSPNTYLANVYMNKTHIRLVHIDIYELITLLHRGDVIDTRNWKMKQYKL